MQHTAQLQNERRLNQLMKLGWFYKPDSDLQLGGRYVTLGAENTS